MCGIWAYLSRKDNLDVGHLLEQAFKIQHRGPDNSQEMLLNDERLLFCFHRLAINDTTPLGNQPLVLDDTYYLICNGEIYNHRELEAEYGITTKGHSDCEVILHLYKKFGIQKTLQLLSGYFAFALWDNSEKELYIARDPIGVRALYWGFNPVGDLCLCSEMKGIPSEFSVSQFPAGKYMKASTGETTAYYTYEYPPITDLSLDEQLVKIRKLFTAAVDKRFMLERPFGVFLSGGLDSSLVAALVAKNRAPERIHSFSIGLEGSTDLKKARVVAEHINSIHHEVIITYDDMLAAIPKVIEQCETYDTTTVRASTPMYLLSKYIKENTDIVVIFSGEGSDEASGSYLYFHNAPSDEAFQEECVRLLRDLHFYDCLRCDKATAGNSLEVRVPFLDREFLTEYMRVPVVWKRPKDGMEKWFIRKAFDGMGLLPNEILWRTKEAFSDGVSSQEKSWYQIIQEHVDGLVSDEEFAQKSVKMTPQPRLKESYYYRTIFDKFYPGRANTIPYYWMPRWTEEQNDPSARRLKVYKSN